MTKDTGAPGGFWEKVRRPGCGGASFGHPAAQCGKGLDWEELRKRL